MEGRMPSLVEQDHMNVVRRMPIGVCGLITPWNHPVLIAVKKISVALAAGNTVVVKPPELAPFTVLHLARILEEAGVPPGVINVVPGLGKVAGEALAVHPLVERVDFTGGTKTGVRIQTAIAEAGKVKPFCAELGGNAPVLVFEDVDIQTAVNGIAFAAFVASGQTCVSAKRILVHETIFDQFLAAIVEKANGLVLGNPLDANTDIGPVISAGQLEMIEGLVNNSIKEGAKAAAGGGRPGPERCSLPGHFFEPTVLTGALPENTAYVEEIFGPVITVTPFKDQADAIRLANTSKYGLGAAIWTKDITRSHTVARSLRSGVIWVNCHHRNDPGSPWGGFGESGVGRENGPEALEEYTTTQSITLRLNEQPEDWFGSKNARYG
jgi:acyl-CoA reductase-like NAD-dependent aldehyde dehydrogenase